MKKTIAFLTALLMLSVIPASVIYAEEEPEKVNEISASESSDATASGEESENTGENPEDVPEKDDSVWRVCAAEPAEAVFTDDTENREYIIEIVNPGGAERGGTDKWDLQFRIRGISVSEGHEYTVKYSISSSQSGSYYTKIGSVDTSVSVGDAVAGEAWHNQYGISTIRSYLDGIIQKDEETTYGSAWSNQSINMGDTLNVECSFTGLADLPESEWTFFLGGAGSTTANDCFAPGTVVCFRNLVLTDNTTGETLVSSYPFTVSAVKGDINGDGIADTTDLSLMSLALIGDTVFDDGQLDSCDLDGDGTFHLADIAHFRQYLSKIIEEL